MNSCIRIIRAVPFALLCALALPAAAAPQPSTTAAATPSSLVGKTFADCEKILGEPATTLSPKGANESFSRFYKPTIGGITRVQLETAYVDTASGPAPEIVNFVHYYFPKGSKQTLGEALELVGVATAGLSLPAKTPLGGRSVLVVNGVAGGMRAIWTSAAASASAPKEHNRHPDEDTLSFMIPKK